MENIVWNFLYTEELRAEMRAVSSRFELAVRDLESASATFSAMAGQRPSGPVSDTLIEVSRARRRLEEVREDFDRRRRAVERADEYFQAAESRLMKYLDSQDPVAGQSGTARSAASALPLGTRLDSGVSPAWLSQAADEEFGNSVP